MNGADIRAARLDLGLSQAQAAALWGINLRTLQDVEQGRSENRTTLSLLETIIRYHRAFGPPPEDPAMLDFVAAAKPALIHLVDNIEYGEAQLTFALTGAEGMARHPYMSRDWVAHNHLYSSAFNELVAKGANSNALSEAITAEAARLGVAINSK